MTQQPNAPFLIGPEDTEHACLLIHGFSGTPAEMHDMGEALANHGIRVYGMQIAGHGGNPEDLIRHGRQQWIASAEEGLSQLAHYPHLFIAGLSTGGVLALILASRHPERIAGTIVLSTPTRFRGGWQVKVVPLARYFVTWFYPLQHLNFNNPKIQAEVLKQARLRDAQATIDFSNAQTVATIKQMIRIPVPAIAEVFSLTKMGRKCIEKIRTPLLIIQSKRDQTVNPQCADELYRLATSASPKLLYWLEQSDHVITTGPERQEVYAQVITFIDAIAPGVAKPALPADVPVVEADETPPSH